MAEKWFDGLPDETTISEVHEIYMNALKTVKAGLERGLDFNRASAAVEIKDEAFRLSVIDDVLKVIIAEEHFVKRMPLNQIAERLNLSTDRLEKARSEMMEDVEKSAVTAYYTETEKGTEH